MSTNERRQLHDEIVSGIVKLADLSMGQLKGLRADLDMDYNPEESFFAMVGKEIWRRQPPARKPVKISKDFFK